MTKPSEDDVSKARIDLEQNLGSLRLAVDSFVLAAEGEADRLKVGVVQSPLLSATYGDVTWITLYSNRVAGALGVIRRGAEVS